MRVRVCVCVCVRCHSSIKLSAIAMADSNVPAAAAGNKKAAMQNKAKESKVSYSDHVYFQFCASSCVCVCGSIV